jgi:hypothetical protein
MRFRWTLHGKLNFSTCNLHPMEHHINDYILAFLVATSVGGGCATFENMAGI